MEEINIALQKKYREINEKEVRYQLVHGDDADILVVAYGLAARICHKAVELARERGVRAALLRPITLYPYPYKALREMRGRLKAALAVEMNSGQMVEDVRLGIEGAAPVHFYGRMGGVIPTPDDVLQEILRISEHPAEHRPGYYHHLSIIEESR
jgi:2-oxoglutarate ferredoxin oxidoreductase subunit alpha